MQDDEKCIYTITTIRRGDAGRDLVHPYPLRTVGYFFERERARDILCNDIGDLDEGHYYLWAVIEAVRPGLYSMTVDREFWTYNTEEERWQPSGVPEELAGMNKHVASFCEIGGGVVYGSVPGKPS